MNVLNFSRADVPLHRIARLTAYAELWRFADGTARVIPTAAARAPQDCGAMRWAA